MSNPTEGQGTVYVFVRGGVVQAVRAEMPLNVVILDMDDAECIGETEHACIQVVG